METVNLLNEIFKYVLFAVGLLTVYQVIFIFIGFFGKGKKFEHTDKKHKYAILISARNEERVIGQLLDSIKKQDYPQEKIKIFVIADDCCDRTAEIAKEYDCVVYERKNPPKNQRTKGFALKFGIENIMRDYERGVNEFDGFFVFDADNLLAVNYVSEMNKAFVLEKYDYFTSYLGEKNLETKIVPTFGSIGLGGLYSADMAQHRTSSVLGLAPMICGKGFLLRSKLLKDGWKWTGLTEDIELRADIISKGTRGCFVEAAELFDENPHTFKILARQRIRWERGSLVAFCKYFVRCSIGTVCPRDWRKKTKEEKDREYKITGTRAKIIDAVQKSFSCYKEAFLLMPRPLIILALGFLYPLSIGIFTLINGNLQGLWNCLILVALFYGFIYLVEIATYTAVIIRERRRIRGNKRRMIKYIFIWPFFTMFIQYLATLAMIIPVKWKPIPHVTVVQIEDIENAKTMFQPKRRKDTNISR
jgi:cellulose synthase/poly-beta-1,6-N-acetylglucosamine synthase-like glycosyltransferase